MKSRTVRGREISSLTKHRSQRRDKGVLDDEFVQL